MKNSERFYYETDFAIKLMYCFLNRDTRNHEYEAKKLLKDLEICGIDPESFRFSLVSLIDITSFALNKEKIENQANLNWNDYKTEITSKLKNFDHKFSQIPYFKEWFQVCECSEKYKKENAQFWIKKIRDAFLHSKFELDYGRTDPLSEIKIRQGTATKADVDIKLYEPGLTEFIEDNFRNVYNKDCGIKDDYSYLQYPQTDFYNFKTLEDYISKITIAKYKIDYNNFTYDGTNLTSADGVKVRPSIQHRQILNKPDDEIVVPEYLVKYDDITHLKPEKANLLARLIDKKASYIYHGSKKRDIVHKYYCNYLFPYQAANSLLHEITNATNYIYFSVDQKSVPKDYYNKCFGLIEYYKENLKPTFTLLQLYRLLYRLQNTDFAPVNYANLECQKLFYAVTPELVQEKVEKIKTKFPDFSEKEATNKAYLDIVRDALAHGNVNFQSMFSDDLSTIDKVFTFTDSWTDKTGKHTDTIIETNVSCLEYLFTTIDKDLEFLPYKDMDIDEI